ncbi:MAG: nucleoside phosphorylase [Deltaproteobacteria bacterium]|nr:nucleoside phosphorylase [Deltaproteobacteria bacterium]
MRSTQSPRIQPTDLFGRVTVQSRSLVVFSPYELKWILSRVSVIPNSLKSLNFSSLQTIRYHDKVLTLAGPAMGAPVAAMVLEVLRAFGARQIIAFGSCGSLDEKLRIGHFIVPERALSDEGTSAHYPLPGKAVKPNLHICRTLRSASRNHECVCHSGYVWTTDAPFRETPKKIGAFRKKHALAVEMELSSFFKASAFYGIETGALLVVSDELFSSKWKSGHTTPAYKKAVLQGSEIVLQALTHL